MGWLEDFHLESKIMWLAVLKEITLVVIKRMNWKEGMAERRQWEVNATGRVQTTVAWVKE